MRRALLPIFAITLLAAVAALVFLLWFQRYLDAELPLEQPVIVEVRPGTNMTQLARLLASETGLAQPRLFSRWARYEGFDTGLRAGEFELRPGMSPRSALMHLMHGPMVQYPVTFIDGTTTRQALAALWSAPKVRVELRDLTDEQILAALGTPFPHIEGILFPDTYFYTAGTSDTDILKRAVTRLQSVLDEEWEQRAEDLPYASPYEALIMASIIEKESGLNSEREQIAGVFVRRLQAGMRLQSDPTIIYGMGDSYQGNIRRVDLDTTTPYNTYRINGLPPTPIALSGRTAIHASLHPSDGSYMYFVARGDGGHQFSTTLEEHNAAVRQYQLNQNR